MYCPNCNQHFDSGKFCPECGVPLVEDAPAPSGASIGLGDYANIAGDIHLTDSHNVHNEDKSVHSITNTTSTVNNVTNVAAQKTEYELQQERKTTYLTACKRAYEDNVLEQHEVVELEELRIKLSLDKATADAILDSVRRMMERNARKSTLNPIAKTKLKILTENLKKNEVKALMDQIDSLEPLVRKFDHDELSRKYFLVLAALKSERCIELYETSMVDSYWKSFWSYLAYIKQGQLTKAENVLISLDRFTEYPEDNVSVLAVAGALMMGNKADAKIYINELTGEHTPALQRFVDSLYLLLEPNTAKEMGANENTCAFYLVNFFGQKDPKAKAEEERLRQKAEKQAEAKRKAEEDVVQQKYDSKERESSTNAKEKEEVKANNKEEKESFDVVLKSFGSFKECVVSLINKLTFNGVKGTTPCVIEDNLDKASAEKLKNQLESAGATISLVKVEGRSPEIFNVLIKSCIYSSKLISVICSHRNLTPDEAWSLIKKAPFTVTEGLGKLDAVCLKKQLEAAGASVDMVKVSIETTAVASAAGPAAGGAKIIQKTVGGLAAPQAETPPPIPSTWAETPPPIPSVPSTSKDQEKEAEAKRKADVLDCINGEGKVYILSLKSVGPNREEVIEIL